MKNKFKLFLILVIGLIMLPVSVNAKTYNKLDFKETLAEEELNVKFTNYKPNKDAITIYLFRGKGCGYCRSFLEFMNSITEEYGKYFNMVTYEVWNDTNNALLLEEVSNYLDNPASGVPYIIIGDKVFPGYASEYDDSIKEEIIKLYNTKEKKRYDVFTEMKKHPNKTANNLDISNILIWNIAFIGITAIVLITYTSFKFRQINLKIDKLIEEKSKPTIDKKSKKIVLKKASQSKK